jgi:hypothetical protein
MTPVALHSLIEARACFRRFPPATTGRSRSALGIVVGIGTIIGVGLLLVAACFGLLASWH